MLGWLGAGPRAASMPAICSRLLWSPPWAPASGKPGSVITLTAAAMPRQVARYTTPKVPLPEAAQHSTAQHSTAQPSTAQHSTAQHSTAQHGLARSRSDQDRSAGSARSHAGGAGGVPPDSKHSAAGHCSGCSELCTTATLMVSRLLIIHDCVDPATANTVTGTVPPQCDTAQQKCRTAVSNSSRTMSTAGGDINLALL